ncbi:histidinol-phosphatase [Micromonospora sediminicola]|uniref:Histidinol-phosphatase n=1 Tax=Micromonospora sediminicola TaxID=946078 RepID=A0A1A9BJD5_9ACTN|nr:inositol monophosphatase family protein [Micromonospora sediminicola]SBT68987.1 histidinol-phosphatase [Micromonospora sediminicola]
MAHRPLTFDLAAEIAETVRPALSDAVATTDLGEVTQDKGGGHTAHKVDDVAEQVLFDALRRRGFQGQVFSEEAGLVRLGADPRMIVCDPYCNTTLTFHGVRESAVAVYEYTVEGEFLSGAIADIQIPRVVWAGPDTGAHVSTLGGDTRAATCSSVQRVEDAFLVVSLLKRNRRQHPPLTLLAGPKLLGTVDGAIVAARIAVGEVDGFVDHEFGQPSYETLAYELVARAGGRVTDPAGEPIDFGAIVRGLGRGEVRRHRILAIANPSLHRDVRAHLAG